MESRESSAVVNLTLSRARLAQRMGAKNHGSEFTERIAEDIIVRGQVISSREVYLWVNARMRWICRSGIGSNELTWR
jgi:hypothetical protein